MTSKPASAPGVLLRSVFRPLLDTWTADHVLDAAIADAQAEWNEAVQANRPREATRARWVGTLSILRTLLGLAAEGTSGRIRSLPFPLLIAGTLSAGLGITLIAGVRPELARGQAVFAMVGVVATLVALMIPARWWRALRVVLAAATALPLLATLAAGQRYDGFQRWLLLGPVQVHTSELVKPLFVLALAGLFARSHQRTASQLAGVLLSVIALGAIALQPDFANVVLFSCVALTMALVARASRGSLVMLGVACLAATVSSAAAQFTGPGAVDLFSASALGGGAGLSPSTLHTDGILGALASRGGLAGMLLLIALSATLGLESIRLARRARDPFAGLLASGVAALFVMQPLTRFALGEGMTFLSFGGSSLVATLACVGLAAHAARPVATRAA